MTGQVAALDYLKLCRGGTQIAQSRRLTQSARQRRRHASYQREEA